MIEHKEVRHALINAFLTPAGKRALEVLADMALADSADYCPDERRGQWLQGRRSLVLDIRRIIKEAETNER